MNLTRTFPVIGITMGDPAGIGPEILVKIFNDAALHSCCRPLVFGDRRIIDQALKLLGINMALNCVDHPSKGVYTYKTMDILDISQLDIPCFHGMEPTARTGSAMQDYILKAIDFALDGQIEGVVTCPITKTAMLLAGSDFHGHTELFAHRTQTNDYAMMLAGDKLKVVLVTIHIPLSDVAESLSRKKILDKIKLTHKSLQSRFNIESPKIAVAGLNPHAGESGMFGREEEMVIFPAIKEAVSQGMDVTGPLPPDTVFFKAAQQKFHAVICMYHDQGLIPFKLLHFKDGVNTTLGLPIVRTSVDHGTAYDIAWKAIADHTSLMQAVKMAAFQAVNRKAD